MSDGRAYVGEGHCFTVSTRLGGVNTISDSLAMGRTMSDITAVHVALIPSDTKPFPM